MAGKAPKLGWSAWGFVSLVIVLSGRAPTVIVQPRPPSARRPLPARATGMQYARSARPRQVMAWQSRTVSVSTSRWSASVSREVCPSDRVHHLDEVDERKVGASPDESGHHRNGEGVFDRHDQHRFRAG